MKIFWIVLAILVVAFGTFALVNYLLQKRRQDRAQRDGAVVYATVLSVENVKGLAKRLDVKKISLRVQDPGTTAPREVTLNSRLPPGPQPQPGTKVAVVIDPQDPKRIYPASPEAAKRVVITGSRLERRHLKPGQFNRQQPQNPGYQPPIRTSRRG